VLYSSATATAISTAIVEALKAHADLRGANLRDANLRGADLRGANLRGADLLDAKGLPLGAVLQIAGSRDWIIVLNEHDVRIGCIRKGIDDWIAEYRTVGEQHGYTAEAIEEYGAHLVYVQHWIAARNDDQKTDRTSRLTAHT